MLENNLAQRQPFEPQEAREPTAEERLEAEQNAIAAILSGLRDNPLTCDAIGANPWAEREIQAAVQAGYENLSGVDEAAIGHVVHQAIRDYVRRLPSFDGEVDFQLSQMRQDRADMAKADDEFEATL